MYNPDDLTLGQCTQLRRALKSWLAGGCNFPTELQISDSKSSTKSITDFYFELIARTEK